MALIFADLAGQKLFKVTCDFQCHKNRGSIDPGEDWGTGDGTGLFSIRPGGIINNWTGSNGIAITSVTYNDLKLRFEFLHVNPNFLHPTAYHLKSGELMLFTGHSGVNPLTGKPYPPHVHINVYKDAHIAENGIIDRKGTRVDPKDYTQDFGLVVREASTPAELEALREENKMLKAKIKQVLDILQTIK